MAKRKTSEDQMSLFELPEIPDLEQPKTKPVNRAVVEKELVVEDSSDQGRLLEYDESPCSRPWLRYFGGKQAALKDILHCFPEDLTDVVSPFIGGGSIELGLTGKGIRVKSFDKFDTLVDIWNIMLENAGKVSEIAQELYPLPPRCMRCSPDNELTFHEDVDPKYCLKCMILSGTYHTMEDDILRAAICWVANKQDWNGRFLGATGFFDHRKGMSLDENGKDKYFRRRRIVKNALRPDFWRNWTNPLLSVECKCWTESLIENPDAFLYADPPYVGNETVYGVYRTKKTHPDYVEFDHEAFAEHMIQRPNGWVMSYVADDKGLVHDLYKDFEIIPMKWHQGSVATRGQRSSFSTKEITILKPPAVNPLHKGWN